MSESAPILAVEGLRVRYGHVVAVDDLSLDVRPNEVVALLGANGAGKTSTLHALSGLVPSRGQVTFFGDRLGRRRPETIARLGLIHVPEGRHVFPNLTVHENIQIGRTARAGRDRGFGVDDVYDLFPALVPLRRRGGWALSGGEQQMVAIGRALTAAPRLLLLDEPSLGLAPTVVASVFDAIKRIVDRVPVLLVEQNTTLAMRICSRAYVLHQGRVVAEGTPEQLGNRRAMIDTYLGKTAGA